MIEGLGGDERLVSDNLFDTNAQLLQQGIDNATIKSLVITVNQLGLPDQLSRPVIWEWRSACIDLITHLRGLMVGFS